MIVPMVKTYMIARSADRDRLLDALRDLGVVHLVPVDPKQPLTDDEIIATIRTVERAVQVLTPVAPSGDKPDISATEAANEVLEIQRRSAEARNRLAILHRQIEQLRMWGNVELRQFDELSDVGVEVRFFSVPRDQTGDVQADCLEIIEPLPGKRMLVAVADYSGLLDVPDDADEIDLPQRDVPSIRAEAHEIDSTLKNDTRRLGELANLTGEMTQALTELRRKSEYAVALNGSLADEQLFAVQGWVPAEQADDLPTALAQAGIEAGVQYLQAAEDETPPTLIRYPRWAMPIKGLFDMLGTLPGYRELDLAPFFMIALPIFAAMLIGDAGYGLLFVLIPALMYRKMTAAVGKPGVHLVIVVGVTTIIWGLLTGVLFGLSPQKLLSAGGVFARAGDTLGVLQVVTGDVKAQAYTIMKISFVMAAIHLSLGQLRQALQLIPDLRALGKIGWAVFLWGIFFVIWYLFFNSDQGLPAHWLTGYLLIVGALMAILFASPSRNVLKTIGLGIAQFPLNALGAFSDSISYIRLMGVGLASTIIGQTFNSLGAEVAGAATWFAAAPVLLFGHGLNIAMCMIAILAHGVRLNMLEFSNNAGVQWSGYAYEPFASAKCKEC